MSKGLQWLAAFSLVALTSLPAFAGYKQSSPVYVNTTSRYASGSLGSARNSADTNQYIGCYAVAYPGFSFAVCVAVDAQSHIASCLSQNDPGMLQTIHSMASDSWIYFSYDTSGACTALQVDKFSQYEPKK